MQPEARHGDVIRVIADGRCSSGWRRGYVKKCGLFVVSCQMMIADIFPITKHKTGKMMELHIITYLCPSVPVSPSAMASALAM